MARIDLAGAVLLCPREEVGCSAVERRSYVARPILPPPKMGPSVRQQVTLPNVIAIPGGLPIRVGDDVIGGAAVSGSPGVDEPCVQAGLDKVADQLK